MDSAHEDLFVLFLRAGRPDPACPEAGERPLASCPTYDEARQLRLTLAADCVIRYVGRTGGGD